MKLPEPETPAVSVVIPAYNYAQFLPRAIDSVLGQTYADLECIVVDDGSTDHTPAVLAAITDPRLHVVRQENGGLSRARNAGVRVARAEFVAFLDADDCWRAEFLERAFLELKALPEHGAVATASARMDAHGAIVEGSRFSFGKTGDLTFRDFCLRNRPLASSIVLRRRALVDSGDFDESLRSSEDRDYWLRLTGRGWKFRFLDIPLAVLRRHDSNMSKAAARMEANSHEVLARAQRAGVIAAHSPFWRKVNSVRLLQSARAFSGQGEPVKAVGLLFRSLVAWPWFSMPAEISERPLFRARLLARMVLDCCRGKKG